MRLLRPALELGQVVGLHAELFQLEVSALFRQQAHDDGFAVDARDHRDADVHVGARSANGNASVLRQPPLGNIESRNQFNARGDGVEAVARQVVARLQHAIDAKPHYERIFLGLDVNVGGLLVDCLRRDVVDQLHHRRFFRQFAQVRHVVADIGLAVVLQQLQKIIQVLAARQMPQRPVLRERYRDGLLQIMADGIARGANQCFVRAFPNRKLLIDEPLGGKTRGADHGGHHGAGERRIFR